MGILDKFKKKKELKQDVSIKAEFKSIYNIWLLFEKQGIKREVSVIKEKLEECFGDIDVVCDVDGMNSFAIKQYQVEYNGGKKMPSQILMTTDYLPFDKSKIGVMEMSQQWECPNAEELLEKANYQMMLSDFMAAGLEYKDRGFILSKCLSVAMELFPDCIGIYNEASTKFLARQQLQDNPYVNTPLEFLHIGLNLRFFNIQGTEDMVVDTLGLYAMDLPDIQYHFHSVDQNDIIRHAFNLAAYIYQNGAIINSGETVEGLLENEKWKCQYEEALIQPIREVLDVNTKQYASGQRE